MLIYDSKPLSPSLKVDLTIGGDNSWSILSYEERCKHFKIFLVARKPSNFKAAHDPSKFYMHATGNT